MNAAAAIAAIRFGLGCTPGQQPGSDPRQWLAQQLSQPDAGPPAASVADAFAALALDREARLAASDTAPPAKPAASHARSLFRTDTQALLEHAITTPTPFRERLVWFWANHFTISIRKGRVAPLVGAYVREAIRPHVTASFSDMLLAVMQHPAMLIYLDNVMSAGPRSPFGARQNRGLNENLARESLELHTVGADAGYTQADVTEYARVLTGWSVGRPDEPAGYRFRPGLAEPGDKTILGQRFIGGETGGRQALQFLANHPATHRHLATRLVQHFVADTPPADAVAQVERVLRDTQGDLAAAATVLTQLPSAWQPLTKLRPPQDLVIAAFRATGLPPGPAPNLARLIGGLGQPPFAAPLPNGWPDSSAEWAGPEALLRRIDWAYGFADRPDLPEPLQLADDALGPLLSAATATQVRQAGSRRDAITLLIASPEFQRR